MIRSLCVSAFIVVLMMSAYRDGVNAHTNQDGPTKVSINGNLTEWDKAAAEFVAYGFYLDSITVDDNDILYGMMFMNLVAGNGTACAEDAMNTCGKGKVCWLCTCWDENGGGHCSYGCDTGNGCTPAPPCGCHTLVW